MVVEVLMIRFLERLDSILLGGLILFLLGFGAFCVWLSRVIHELGPDSFGESFAQALALICFMLLFGAGTIICGRLRDRISRRGCVTLRE
jgi:MFS family permease